MKLGKLGLISILTASALFAGNYNIDTVHSNVGFKVKHMMITNINGNFTKFIGNFVYDEKTKKIVSLNGSIDVKSVSTKNETRDADLRSPNFFDVQKYPKITYALNSVNNGVATGILSIHGVSKEVKMDLENNGMAKDPWGNTRVGLELNGKINRSDFGLMYNKVLETGGVLVGKTVKLTIELEGVLAK